MDVSYVGEVDTGDSNTLTVATDGTFLAYAVRGGDGVIALVYLADIAAPCLQLACELQTRAITAMCMGSGTLATSDPHPEADDGQQSALLCTASKDSIVVWDLVAAYDAAANDEEPPLPKLVMSGQGVVDALVMSSRHQALAVCVGLDVNVFDLATMQHTFRLEGHTAPVLAAAFFDHSPHLLITAGEDRTFKVWDLNVGQLTYQSSILGAAPITALAVDPSYPRLAAAASDGVVRFFDLSSLPACRNLQVVDVPKQLNRIADQASAAAAKQAAAGAEAGPRVISSQPAWKRNGQGGQAADDAAAQLEATSSAAAINSTCVLSLYYSPLRTRAAAGATGLLAEAPKLLVATMRGLAVVDTHTYEVVEGHYFAVPSFSGRADAEPKTAVTGAAGALRTPQRAPHCAVPESAVAGAFAFGLLGDARCLICCAAAAFEPGVAVLRLVPAVHGGQAAVLMQEELDEGFGLSTAALGAGAVLTLSVFQTNPLPDNSPLRPLGATGSSSTSGASPRTSSSSSGLARSGSGSELKRQSSTSGGTTGTAGSSARSSMATSTTSSKASTSTSGRPPAGKGVTNQPVTFHSKIKSSGYGFVQQKQALGTAPRQAIKVSKSQASSSTGKHLMAGKQYPVGCAPLTVAQPRNSLPKGAAAHHGAIMRIAFSSDASRLLTASVDKTARVLKLPLSKYGGEGTDLIGHNAALHSATWSHDGTMVLTASADRSARLWNAGHAQPLLEFTNTLRQATQGPTPTPAPGAPKKPPNPLFLHEVRAARFFYLDQFILLAVSSKLHLYRVTLSDDKGDDIERLRNNNKYKLVDTYTGAAQVIHDVSCINSFLSPLALLAGSHRGVEVLDLSTMQCVSSIADVHSRPPHTIVQAATSLYVSHPKEAYELFATAAADGTAKLWDVRCARCVRTFSGHKNTQVTIGVSFSPCLRYFAAGSEDKVAYLYDLRMGTIVHRVRGTHGEAVTDVAFNPLHPQLATATLDGHVHFYSDVA